MPIILWYKFYYQLVLRLIVTRQPRFRNSSAKTKPNPRVLTIITTLRLVSPTTVLFSSGFSTVGIHRTPDLFVESTLENDLG